MKKELILLSNYGICNRLICMATWAVVAKALGREFSAVWLPGKDVCDASFHDLFTNQVNIVGIDRLKSIKAENNFKEMIFSFGFNDGDKTREYDALATLPEIDANSIVVNMSCYFVPRFIHEADMEKGIESWLRELIPVNDVMSFVDDFCAEHQIDPHNSNITGLHIRRTDGQRDLNLSTLDQFARVMEAEMEKNAEAHFFLATDCEQTEAAVKKIYGERVVSAQKKYLAEYRTTSAKHAMIDLYILTRTHQIFGSFGSSYSKVASIIRGCPFLQVGMD